MPIDWNRVARHQMVCQPQHFVEHIEVPTLEEAALDLLTIRNEGGMMSMRRIDDRDKPGNVHHARSALTNREAYRQPAAPVPIYDLETLHVVEVENLSRMSARDTHQIIAATHTPMSLPAAESFVDLMRWNPHHRILARHLASGIDLNGSDSYFAVNGPALAIPLTEPPKPPRRRGGGKAPRIPKGWTDTVNFDGTRPLHLTVQNPYGVTITDFTRAADEHPDLAADDIVVDATALTDIAIDTAATETRTGRTGHAGDGLRTAYAVMVNDHPVGYYDTVEEAHAAAVTVVNRPPEDLTYLHDRFHNPFHTAYEVQPVLLDADGREARLTSSLRVTEATGTLHVRTETLTPPPTTPSLGMPVTGWLLAWQTPDWHRHRTLLAYLLDENGTVLYQVPNTPALHPMLHP